MKFQIAKAMFVHGVALVSLAAANAGWAAPPPRPAPVLPVTENYFGTSVIDNYRYMEDLQSPEVQQWMKAQADHTRAVVDAIPGRAALARRIDELAGSELRRYNFQRRNGRIFYDVLEPGSNLPKLAYRDGINSPEHIVVDPNSMSRDAAHHVALDWYSASWDGRYVAYGMSEGGSEKSVMHVTDLQTGRQLAEAIDRTSSCVVSWRKDNASFLYLRYPQTNADTPPSQREYNARTYLHVLGRNSDGNDDEAVFGRGVADNVDVPEAQGTYVLVSPDSRFAIAVANRNMDDNPNTFYVAPLDRINGAHTQWTRIATPSDGVTDVQLHGDRLYMLSEKGAPHFRILSMSLVHPDLARATVVVPDQPAAVIAGFAAGRDGLYISRRSGATFTFDHVNYEGHESRRVELPFSGALSDLSVDQSAPGAMFQLQGWVTSPRELIDDAGHDTATDTGLIPPAKTESTDVEAHEALATSYDGTRVPVSIIARKGIELDGSHPTIVIGYGSYGVSIDPHYVASWQAWTEMGGVIAVAHIRGGGEYGDDWHRAGQKLMKINSMLDFIASAHYLIDQHYTRSGYLAANGGSAGGIVMGGALTIDPGLFRVVLDNVGESDTLRMETEPNGPPNVPEFGSASTERGFKGLYLMSAYQHIHDGVPYPAAMFTTGANDPRVAPWHMLKMTARLQAATSSGNPVLLRVDYDGGHGMGSSRAQRDSQMADEWSFALWQMGVAGYQPIR